MRSIHTIAPYLLCSAIVLAQGAIARAHEEGSGERAGETVVLDAVHYPFQRTHILPVQGAAATFRVTLKARRTDVLDNVRAETFRLSVPDQSLRQGESSRPVAIGDETPTASCDLVVLLEPIGPAPKRLEFFLGSVPVDRFIIINAGHYQSEAVRDYARSGWSTATFLHTHCPDCSTHTLFVGGFSWCTYAYDCYAGHAVAGAIIQGRGNYAIQYGGSCYEARCP